LDLQEETEEQDRTLKSHICGLGDPDELVQLHRADKADILTDWRDKKSLYLLNLVYDVTPSSFIDMVVTEIGMIPCTSVPVVLRVKNSNEMGAS